MIRVRVAAVSVTILWLAVAPAAAQQPPKEQARKHFLAAKALEEAGNYKAAAAEYLTAYDYFAEPEFFYNAGRAYELGGDFAKAVEYYRKYVELAPDGRAADLAQAAIASLTPKIPAPPESEKVPDSGKEGTTQGSPTQEADRDPEVPSPEGGPDEPQTQGGGQPGLISPEVEEQSEGSPGSSRVFKISGLSAAAVGIVATAVGIKYGLDARRLADEISDNRESWTNEDLAKFSEGESASTRSYVFTGVGGAAMIAGGALYYWGMRQDTKPLAEHAGWLPSVSSGTVGVAFMGRF
jgi:tetratricopeptide (TPR) repeat protein